MANFMFDGEGSLDLLALSCSDLDLSFLHMDLSSFSSSSSSSPSPLVPLVCPESVLHIINNVSSKNT